VYVCFVLFVFFCISMQKLFIFPVICESIVVQVFTELKDQKVRIIIADFLSNVARAVMCEAYRQVCQSCLSPQPFSDHNV
jgi:hypothetical protein